MSFSVAFDRVQHLVRIPVEVGEERLRFLLDTGIGVTVVSSSFAARADVTETGETYDARRMSGQVVSIPLVRLPDLEVGGFVVPAPIAAVADLGDEDGPSGFTGILGYGLFGDHAVTTDVDARTITIGRESTGGTAVQLHVHRDGPAVDPFVDLVLPSGRTISVEVDTGSPHLILDPRFLADCGLTPDDARLEVSTGVDETGHAWTRSFATIDGAIHLAAAPDTAQHAPRVQFQKIVHDGLVGTDYLERYRFTVDLSAGVLVLEDRTAGG